MKDLTIIIILCLLFSCNNNDPIPIYKDNGEVIESYSNGYPKIIHYKEDTILVKKMEFYENGQQKSEYLYSDSVRYEYRDEEGNLTEKGVLDFEEKNGLYVRYNDGFKKDMMFLFEGNVYKTVYFYSDGNKKMEFSKGSYSDMSNSRSWYENGQLKSEESEFGVGFEYNESGSKKLSYFSDNKGRNDSTWTYFDEQGNIIKEELWENGELIETKEY